MLLHSVCVVDVLLHSVCGVDVLLHSVSGVDMVLHSVGGVDVLLHNSLWSRHVAPQVCGVDVLLHSVCGVDVLLHNSLWSRHVAPLNLWSRRVAPLSRIILILSQRVSLTLYCSREAVNTNFINLWFDPMGGSNPRSTTLEASTPTITTPYKCYTNCKDIK